MSEEQVGLNFKGLKEMPAYDYSQHVGKKVVIADIEERKHNEYGYYVLVSSVALDSFENNEKEVVEIKATKILNLFTDKDETGNESVFVGKGSKTDLFLKSMGIENGDYKLLQGKDVQVTKILKGEKTYLTFEKP